MAQDNVFDSLIQRQMRMARENIDTRASRRVQTPEMQGLAPPGEEGATENGLRSVIARNGMKTFFDYDTRTRHKGEIRMRGIRGSKVGKGPDGTQGANLGIGNSLKSFATGPQGNRTSLPGGTGGGEPTKLGIAGLRRGGQVPLPVYNPGRPMAEDRRKMRASPKHKAAMKEVRALGFEPSPDDPKGDLDAVDKHLAGKRMKKEAAEKKVGLRKGGQVPCFNRGGVAHPGVPKAGKIKMLENVQDEGVQAVGDDIASYAEPTGPIGDPAMDTGEDTVDAKVRPGEVLLNPPTVEFLGGGDYEQGLRMLNEITVQATGEPMGAEYDEEGDINAQNGVALDEFGRPISGTQPVVPMNAGQAAGQRGLPPPDVVNDTRAAPRGGLRGGPSVGPAPTAFREGLRVSNPNVNVQGVVDAAKRVGTVTKGAAKIAAKPLNYLARRVPGISAGFEAVDVADVATDPNMTGLDTAEQASESAAKFAAATTGAIAGGSVGAMGGPLAPLTVPLGMAIGGGLSYYGAGKAIDYGRGLLPGHNGEGSSPSTRSNGVISQMLNGEREVGPSAPAAPTQPAGVAQQEFISPQGVTYREGSPDPVGNYLANQGQDADTFGGVNAGNLRDIPGAPGTQYAGRYGGQEVLATTGPNGEASFTGLRTPQQVEASRQRSIQDQPVLTTEEAQRERYQDLVNHQKFEAYEGETQDLAGIVAETDASRQNGRSTKLREETDKRTNAYFQQAVRDDDGQVTKHIPDPDMVNTFNDALAQMVEADGSPVDFYSKPKAEQNKYYQEFKRQHAEAMKLVNKGASQGVVVPSTLRTPAAGNVPQYEPGSNIQFGDVMRGDFSGTDYLRGMFSDHPQDDGFLVDPENGLRMSAYDMIRDGRGNVDPRLVQRYGLPTKER